MTNPIRLTIPGVPPSLNRTAGRANVWDYRATKKKWTEAVVWAIRAAKIRPEKPYDRARVLITYYFPTAARHDADNYSGKYLLDGLTQGGIIVDDDLKHISTAIRGEIDREHPRTVILVEEVV